MNKTTLGRASKKSVVSNRVRIKHDLYPTPPCAVKILLSEEKFYGRIWECSAGRGDIIAELRNAGYKKVFGTDIASGVDFLKCRRKVENIITNPPYSLAREFILQANKLATKKFALLLRATFFCTPLNIDTIFPVCKPTKIIGISGGVPVWSEDEQKWKHGGFFDHAWYVFDKSKEKLKETVIVYKKIKDYKNEEGI